MVLIPLRRYSASTFRCPMTSHQANYSRCTRRLAALAVLGTPAKNNFFDFCINTARKNWKKIRNGPAALFDGSQSECAWVLTSQACRNGVKMNRGVFASYPHGFAPMVGLYFWIPRRAHEKLTVSKHLHALLTCCSSNEKRNELHSTPSVSNREILCVLHSTIAATITRNQGCFAVYWFCLPYFPHVLLRGGDLP